MIHNLKPLPKCVRIRETASVMCPTARFHSAEAGSASQKNEPELPPKSLLQRAKWLFGLQRITAESAGLPGQDEVGASLVDKRPTTRTRRVITYSEDDVGRIRNISGLSARHRRLVNGEDTRFKISSHPFVGESSTPLKAAINDHYRTIAAEEKYKQTQLKAMQEGLRRHVALKKEFTEKVAQEEAARQAVQQQKEQTVREIQQFVGYAISHDDPKFQELYDKKRQEERKAARVAKKQAEKQAIIEQLQATAESIADQLKKENV